MGMSTSLHLKEARTHLKQMAVVLGGTAVLLVVVVVASVFRLTERGDAANAWPAGTPITSADALTLDQVEQESFDRALLGSPAAAPKHPLEHLPPIPADGRQTLWQTPQEALLPSRSDRIQQMIRCMGRASCDAEEIERLGRSALPVLGNPMTSGGPCGYEPKTTDSDKRVPIAMVAIAMAWDPDCRTNASGSDAAPSAVNLFSQFRDYVERSSLKPEQKEMGLLYARFQVAKLYDSDSPDTPRFLDEMRAIVKQVTQDARLQQAYVQLAELPAWGLSMPEIRAEYMLAQTRSLAQLGTPSHVAGEMAKADLFTPELSLQSPNTPMSLGRSHLQIVWCALALRAGTAAKVGEEASGGSNICLQTLVAQRAALPADLVCGLQVRLNLRDGNWNPPSCDSGTDARTFMERMAESRAIWWAALKKYDDRALPADQRLPLQKYLTAYAVPSGNRMPWLLHEHLGASIALLMLVVLALVLLGYLLWAWRWRLRELQRILPPPLMRD
jgi:hypothetical protein